MADTGAAGSRADRLALAEAAINALKGEYSQQLLTDVEQLSSIFTSVSPDNPDAAALDDLFDVAHNIKGQAGSFGYHLVTSIAGTLCDLLRQQSGQTRTHDVKIIGQHVQVLKRVVDKDVVGDGGETGEKIVQSLRALHPKP